MIDLYRIIKQVSLVKTKQYFVYVFIYNWNSLAVGEPRVSWVCAKGIIVYTVCYSISVYLICPILLHSETLEGMRKWHLGKHSTRGPCSCSGWCPRHSLHFQWSRTSILAFYWHGKVTGHEGMPVELWPELVNIYFQACCCLRWAYTYVSFGGSCGKDNWKIRMLCPNLNRIQWRTQFDVLGNGLFFCFLVKILKISS